MPSQAFNYRGVCTECGSSLVAIKRQCPACKKDAGAPNVRLFCTPENQDALQKSFDIARTNAEKRGCLDVFNDFEKAIKTKSGVVVSMPPSVARKLVEDPKALYNNYEELVGSGLRKPADPDNDRHRCAVAGYFFGSFADDIVYGVLSLTGEGLTTYGSSGATIHSRLKSIFIDDRTSFLIMNSYEYVKSNKIVAGANLPIGKMSCWGTRHLLACVKLENSLTLNQTELDWQNILIRSDGINRNKDDFIEAYIHDGFDINAIESMTPVVNNKASRGDRLDVDIALHKFNSRQGNTK